MNSTDRFLQRQRALQKRKETAHLVLLPSSEEAARLAAESVDAAYVNAPTLSARFDQADTPVDATQVVGLLEELAQQVDRARVDAAMDEVQANVMQSIAGPFGLGKFLAAYDRDGGNVNTTHNVRAGIYASEEERQRFGERGKLDKDALHGDPRYTKPNAEMGEAMRSGTLIDTYTNEPILPSHANDSQLKNA